MTKMDRRKIENLLRSHLVSFEGYSAATSPETLAGKVDVPVGDIIKLDANENPYGCSPKVVDALVSGARELHIYPDDGQQELRKLLARYAGVSAEQVVAAGGSNQLIDLIVRLFVNPGDEVINCVPTFDIYRFSTEIGGGKLVNVLRDDRFAINVEAVKAAVTGRTKLIFIASPNNPTGNAVPRRDILEIIDTGLPVVVDEAYGEFSGESLVPLVSQHSNLMVLRTFSKWAGLAGLRVGYGVFSPVIAGRLLAIKIPYNVNVLAISAVRASLADLDYLMGRVKAIITERARLLDKLKEIDWLEPFPSQANFIFCRVKRGNAADIHKAMQKKGILIRYFDKPLLKNSLRISVGKPEHTDALIKTLYSLGI